MFHATCHLDGYLFDTTSPEVFVDHMRTVHRKRRLSRDSLAASTDRGWRTPSAKPFNPGPFDVGAWVTWHDKTGTHTGQVWAVAGPRHRWVADGVAFHDVYEDQLLAERSAA